MPRLQPESLSACAASDPYEEVADPAAFAALVAAHLLAPGAGATVAGASVEFVRRGQGRGLAQHRVVLRDAAGEREAQVSAVVFDGTQRAVRAWERAAATLPASAGPLLPAALVADRGILLQTFPFDHQLPALGRLTAGAWPELAAALAPALGRAPERWQAEPARYRVGIRASVRLTVPAAAAEPERVLYAKVHARTELATRDRDLHAALAAAVAADPTAAELGFAPVVATLPDRGVVVHAEVTGTPLGDLLPSPAAGRPAVRRVARALAALHRLDLPESAPLHDLERSGPERLRRDAARLVAARPDLAPLVAEVEAAALAGLVSAEPRAAAVHGDLKPAHVIMDGDRAVLLDLDKLASGNPVLDVVSMAQKLSRGRAATGALGGLAGAFVREYFAHAPAAWADHFAPQWAAALLAEAANLGKTVRGRERLRERNGRADRPDLLLAQAHATLSGVRTAA